MRQRLAAMIAAVLIAATLGLAGPASATTEPGITVLDWNRYAIEAIFNPGTNPVPGAGQTPPVGGIHLAMVQLAVYDAVNAIDGGHEPYLGGLPAAAAGASQAAAAAVSAHDVLVALPGMPGAAIARLDGHLATTLGAVSDVGARNSGAAIGAAVAAALLASRANDGRFGTFRFTVPTNPEPGDWVPTSGVNDPNGWVARVRPFTLRSTSQFRTEGPLPLDSAEYAAEFNEVRAIGSVGSSVRTTDQTAMALYFTENPFALFGRSFRALAGPSELDLSMAEAARFFAMTTVAGADAAIGCWDDKDHWSFWRPVTAIAQALNDGNPATSPEAGWTPLVANPPYPDHPSGYNCATGGHMYAARAFFRTDRMAFKLINASMVERPYSRFTDVLDDTIDARIYLGIHFRTPDVQGAWLGKKVAQWLSVRFFEPVR